MSAAHPEPSSADGLVARLEEMLAELGDAAADDRPAPDSARIDRIAGLEKLRAVTAALQAADSVRFAQSQVAEQLAADVHPSKIGRGIAKQIGLACRISPVTAAQRLNTARALWFELPDAYNQLRIGMLSERVAEAVVAETRHHAATRSQVDTQLANAGINTMGFKAATACARMYAYQADPEGYLRRGRIERRHRRVGIRPAPDAMAILTAYRPIEQGVASCYAALRRYADTVVAAGESRTRDQIMADTLVEPLTREAAARDLNIELQLMMPLDALIKLDDRSAAMIPGYGPLPQELAWEILITSRGRKWWRRLFTAPTNESNQRGPIVGGDPTPPPVDGWLAKLIRLRDQGCRDPHCDAPIRHIDHITRHSDDEPTILENGRGTCERGN
jgi:Domain of unknown function (DUF222)